MIVVDTNIIAYFYLEGLYNSQAERVFSDDPHWAAPILWRSEFRNVLALYLRREVLSFVEANKIVQQAEALMQPREHTVSSMQVLQLVKGSACSAYDCEFVALAQALDVPLVTADRKIVKNFPATAVALDEYA